MSLYKRGTNENHVGCNMIALKKVYLFIYTICIIFKNPIKEKKSLLTPAKIIPQTPVVLIFLHCNSIQFNSIHLLNLIAILQRYTEINRKQMRYLAQTLQIWHA